MGDFSTDPMMVAEMSKEKRGHKDWMEQLAELMAKKELTEWAENDYQNLFECVAGLDRWINSEQIKQKFDESISGLGVQDRQNAYEIIYETKRTIYYLKHGTRKSLENIFREDFDRQQEALATLSTKVKTFQAFLDRYSLS